MLNQSIEAIGTKQETELGAKREGGITTINPPPAAKEENTGKISTVVIMAPSSHASNPKVESSKQTVFTPEMRDRQARGKDPYHSDSEDSDWAPGQTSGHGDGTGPARSGS